MLTLVYLYLLTGAAITALCAQRLSEEGFARAMAAATFIILAWPVVVIGSMR